MDDFGQYRIVLLYVYCGLHDLIFVSSNRGFENGGVTGILAPPLPALVTYVVARYLTIPDD